MLGEGAFLIEECNLNTSRFTLSSQECVKQNWVLALPSLENF